MHLLTFARLRRENGLEAILHELSRIGDTDETDVQLAPGKRKVLAFRGMEDVFNIQRSPTKQILTVLATISASGYILPPFVLYPFKRNQPWMAEENQLPFTLTESGWMNCEAFCVFITEQFIPELKKRNVVFPVLLLLDGHRSHVNLTVTDLCIANEIILYCFPPNTTHIMQPADVGFFKPFKDKWRAAVNAATQKKEIEKVTVRNFSPILAKVWSDLPQELAQESFRACGIFPWDLSSPKYIISL